MSTEASEADSLVPTWPEFIIPTLRVLNRDNDLRRRDLMHRVAEDFDLSQDALQERLPSGTSRYEQRMGWTLSNISKASWVERPSKGIYRITPMGLEAMQRYSDGFNYSLARQVFHPYWPHNQKHEAAASHGGNGTNGGAISAAASLTDPEEVVEDAIQRINREVQDDLLDRLQTGHPDHFEKAVVDLLLAMGYGGADQRGRRIGGPGDGGVDGVIDQDALGIDQIYIQAKRYATGNKIGRKEIQAFVGALQGQGATRGVFLTTSEFTDEAWHYADAVQSRIILIDGKRLTSLMLEHQVGVQVKKPHLVMRVDGDYFD